MVDLIHVSFLVGQGLLVLDSDFHHVLLDLYPLYRVRVHVLVTMLGGVKN